MKEKINVYLRIKNSQSSEISPLWKIDENTVYHNIGENNYLEYSCFQSIYFDKTTNELYKACIRNIVMEFIKGINGTIFAYGQTGSGKTYTMLGTEADPGIIKLSLEEIFKEKQKFFIEISYLEIYNEKLIDLINSEQDLKLYSIDTLIISNLTRIEVGTLNQALEILDISENKRKTGKTEFNERSSRSHTIFQIYLHYKDQTSVLSLIDLAGSERASGSIERRKEGAFINKSLLALGNVINNLSKKTYTGFRDSKLTRILQPSLDGSSNVVALCMISPEKECFEESISTLKFSARLSKVELGNRHTRIKRLEPEKNKCKLCGAIIDEKSGIKKNTMDSPLDNSLSTEDDINYVSLEDDSILQESSDDDVKKEIELLTNRIKILEDMIKLMLYQNPSRKINEIFILEKNMFNLQYEILKKKSDNNK
ncbi:Kinesin-like protein KIN-7N [Astathelohania contejeani]|uniref:Kinesin-like protein n=1 Tax=Astathelohania contejeani TaxID=164912 RepID=A0ABQ7HZ33_9MICR|nr:Kinesin-like protein KIN-7N [Thelohania contejeani]